MNARTSKWEREPHPPRLILQPRDEIIIMALYTFRYLSREQLQRLFGWRCIRRINMRLRRLYDHHYLSRTFLPTVRGSGKAIYYLGHRGIPIASQKSGTDISKVTNAAKQTAQLKALFLTHALQINDVRITVTQAVRNHPHVNLETWVNENDCEQEYFVTSGEKQIVRRFQPDGYFRLWHQKKLYSFFLEFDRSTTSLARFKTKTVAYLHFAGSSLYTKRFGVRYFRVLVITTSLERLANLKETVETVTDRMFWFTTFDRLTVDTAFGPVWQRAGHQGLFPLLPRAG
jgi:hypothetical protein